MTPFILLFVGLLLIFFEFYLPGGVLGTLGGIVVIASVVVFAMQYDSLLAIVAYTIGTFVVLFFLVKFALWRIKNAKAGMSIYSDDDQEGFIASGYDKSSIGKVGVVETDLKPGGHIVLESKKHSAISKSGYITKGSQIIVIGGEGESLFVKSYRKE